MLRCTDPWTSSLFVRFEDFFAVKVAQLPSEETVKESLWDEKMIEPPSVIFFSVLICIDFGLEK
jgi:hypothetical protein